MQGCIKQELSYRRQIARKLRTQYVEGVAYSTQLRAISDAASSHDISSRPAECRTSYIIVGLYL